MSDIYIISDTHFNHSRILEFEDKNGEKIRKFKDVDEMNERIIYNWNSTVRDQDYVIHLGDVIFGNPNKYDGVLRRLRGKKTLILGNHDYDARYFSEHFISIRSSLRIELNDLSIFFSHYPTMKECFTYDDKKTFNLHGHIHEKKIEDPVYENMCVEHTQYTPINLDIILDYLKNKKME